MAETNKPMTPETTKTHSLLAEYHTVDELLAACRKVRDAGYKVWDAHTPFPVHGIEKAMGVPMTILPWIVLGAGLTGLGAGILMQWWMNAHDYAFMTSGKPMWSIPANIPVAFEVTVLFSALTTFFGALALNLLPDHYSPLFKVPRFAKVTDDKFFIAIEAKDPAFALDKTRTLLQSTGAHAIEVVADDSQVGAAFPRPLVYVGICAALLALVPLAIAVRARYATSDKPRFHVIYDVMDNQPKLKSQRASTFFADGRGNREPVVGTVAQDSLELDDHWNRGVVDGAWATDFPRELALTDATMKRGQRQFDIYCAVCHGQAGNGDGMVARRAAELAEGTWVPPTSIHADAVKAQAVGQLYNTVANGVRNMPGYASQLSVSDRWSIVLYLGALQRSQLAQLSDVPADQKSALQ